MVAIGRSINRSNTNDLYVISEIGHKVIKLNDIVNLLFGLRYRPSNRELGTLNSFSFWVQSLDFLEKTESPIIDLISLILLVLPCHVRI